MGNWTLSTLMAFVFIFTSQSGMAAADCTGQAAVLGEGKFQIQVLKFQSHPENQKSILILPPTGGTNYLDRSYARTFCLNGFDAWILERWSEDDEYNLELEIHQRFYSRAQKAIGLALAKIQSPFVGLLGTSVGALYVANAVTHFPQINAAFAIVGGASLEEIIANSDQEVLVKVRQERFQIYGFKTVSEYVESLKKTLSFDLLAKPANSQIHLGMVVAQADQTVPTKNQWDLQRSWQPEFLIQFDGGHFSSILKTWLFYEREIVDFFDKAS